MDIKVDRSTVIVFDLDDTLYNELDFLKSAYKAISIQIAQDGYKELYALMLSLYRSKQNVFKYLTENYPIQFSELIELYRNHKPDIRLFDQVLEFIKIIKDNKGRVAIITDGRELTQMAKIRALGIEKYLDKIIISEVLGSEKPAEANYKIIEDEFPDCKYCYIADNLKKDFVTPNKLGWQTIGLVDNGLNIHFQGYKYLENEYMPRDFILSYEELKVV